MQYIDLWPDLNRESCAAAYDHGITANFVERTPKWHHMAVTWSKEEGITKIYKDGLLMSEVSLAQKHEHSQLSWRQSDWSDIKRASLA